MVLAVLGRPCHSGFVFVVSVLLLTSASIRGNFVFFYFFGPGPCWEPKVDRDFFQEVQVNPQGPVWDWPAQKDTFSENAQKVAKSTYLGVGKIPSPEVPSSALQKLFFFIFADFWVPASVFLDPPIDCAVPRVPKTYIL